MRLKNHWISEVGILDAMTLRGMVSNEEPTMVVVHYKVIPFVTVLFYPPVNCLWKIFPSTEVCQDQNLEGDDVVAEHLLNAELSYLDGSSLAAGILNIADYFEKSNSDKNIGPWRFRFNAEKESVDRLFLYLSEWWTSLSEACLARIDDQLTNQSNWWERQWEFLVCNDFCFFMQNVWRLDVESNERVIEYYRSRGGFEKTLLDGISAVSPGVEVVASMPGDVMRSAFIKMHLPNRKLVASVKSSHPAKLGVFDGMYSLQCRIVDAMDLVSMYWASEKSYDDYRSSLNLSGFQGDSSFTPDQVMEKYLSRMLNRYPILGRKSL